MKCVKNITLCAGMMFVILFSPLNLYAESCGSDFEEQASEVIISVLETEPQKKALFDLYDEVCFMPVWVKEKSLSQKAQELFLLIKEDRTLSHVTHLYNDTIALEKRVEEVYANADGFDEKINLEFSISDLYKRYAEYRLYGSIDWNHFYAALNYRKQRDIIGGWVNYKPETTPALLLEEVNDGESLKKAFFNAEPKEYHYAALKQALFSYLDLREKGDWEPIVFQHTIRPENDDELIPVIRERLRMTGEYTECPDENNTYDSCLKESIVTFQKHHGLAPDGVIGKQTISALNEGLDGRIDTIRLNLDRIKWLHQRGEARHIIVNIPAFTLYFEENSTLRLQMKVITGKRKNPTPIFSNTVQHIVLNPYWNVPKSIIQKEMIPKILENPNAMVKEGIDIYTGWGRDAKKIDARSVDWEMYRTSRNVPFRFAQPPGYKNALGKVKFLFPNRFSVYMHDTPSKSLFNRTVRAFSHGCIRLEKPRELLKTFASFNKAVNFDAAQKWLRGNNRMYLNLDQTVPIDVVYLTAWVDYDGVLQFRDDIYGYDKIQLSKMKEW